MTFDHKGLPFSELHRAKVAAGLLSARPLAPEGAGDAYLATDTNELYVCYDTAPTYTWTLFETTGGGGLAYSGTKRNYNVDLTLPGRDAANYLDFPQTVWNYTGFGTGGINFNQIQAGLYEYHLAVRVGNTDAGRWHIEITYDNLNQADIVEFYADGSGNPLTFTLSGQFLANKGVPDADALCYVYIYHNTPTDQDVLTWSFMTLQYLGAGA